MAATTPAEKSGNTTTTQKLMADVAALDKKVDALHSDLKTITTEILGSLNALKEQVAAAKTSKPRSTGAGKGASTPTKPKGYNNSLYWFKDEWKKNRDACVKKYCTEKIMKTISKHMEEDEKAKTKTGDAKLAEEVRFFWETYVKPKDCIDMRKKIKAAFDEYKESFAAANKTPAKDGDGDADAAPADGDDADGDE
jgi:hypothetical protein